MEVNQKVMISFDTLADMKSSQHERLRQARIEAEYDTASAAAEAMGVKIATYNHHENGTAGLSRAGSRYAAFFRVNLEWLLTGKGQMRPKTPEKRIIPVLGLVGAGAAVEMIGETARDSGDSVEIPGDGLIAALIVKGASQWPRFLEGEAILYDPKPVSPATLVGQYAVVQTTDGRKLIKTLRRNPSGGNKWRLESHNAVPEEDVELIAAWRYLGTIPPA